MIHKTETEKKDRVFPCPDDDRKAPERLLRGIAFMAIACAVPHAAHRATPRGGNLVHGGLHVVVDAAPRHAAERGERAGVRIEQHLVTLCG
ncbi:hypothetical protein, partial [Burkholderia contaminans]|uniref:hypothetical protein n=1 Tax=Burkholderia contaminans TaxID=488447 RepID=UPI001C2ED9DE